MKENDPRKIEDHKLPSIFLGSHNASPKPLLRANEMTILFEMYLYIALPPVLRTVVNCIFLDISRKKVGNKLPGILSSENPVVQVA